MDDLFGAYDTPITDRSAGFGQTARIGLQLRVIRIVGVHIDTANRNGGGLILTAHRITANGHGV